MLVIVRGDHESYIKVNVLMFCDSQAKRSVVYLAYYVSSAVILLFVHIPITQIFVQSLKCLHGKFNHDFT